MQRSPRSLGDLLFLLDKDLTIDLQRQRRDLYFVHAGVVASHGSAVAFVAPSGTGKSTTVWSLLRHGLKYVSDEMMPVNIETRRVLPYPRAVCLKTLPTGAYSVPASTIHAGRLHYVPLESRAMVRPRRTLRLRTIFLVERNETEAASGLQPVNLAEAAVRLYANTLNALAHPGLGLDAAMLIARSAPCYRLSLGGVEEAVAAILNKLDEGWG
jgi:hypothetical protein